MPRLLQLNVTANWGSTGKIAEGIGLAAMTRGWESAIAYGRMQNPSLSETIKVGSQFEVYLHYAKNRIVDGEGLGSVRATKRLLGQIVRLAPDIVHIHNIHDHWLNYPLLLNYLKSSDVHVVWTFHDCWAFTGGCPHFVESGCAEWMTECRDCRIPRSVIDRTNRNFTLKRDLIRALGGKLTIVSVSKWLDSLVADSVFGNLNHQVIYNGIDTNLFSPHDFNDLNRRFSLDNKQVLLGVSSVWTESKGLSEYFTLRHRLPDNFIIVLVGLSPRQINSLPEGIVGIPRTNSLDELAALYSRADAVLCLSKAETFGLTLVEGWACGTPSIGYADTAIKEMLSPAVGIPVRPGDIDGLVAAVKSLSEGTVRFEPLVCRQYAVKNFNQKLQYDKYVDLYESLINK